MKAVVCTRYGPPEVLQLRELPQPVPGRGEVRIRVRATAVTSSDCLVRSLDAPLGMRVAARLAVGVTKPRSVPGMVVAGQVDATGKDVRRFTEGDQVLGFDRFAFGCYGQYKCMPESGLLTAKPSQLSYEEAAAIPYGGLLALYDTYGPSAMAITPDGTTAYVNATDGVIPLSLRTMQAGKLIDVAQASGVRTDPVTVSAIVASPDDKGVYVGTADGSVYPVSVAGNHVGKPWNMRKVPVPQPQGYSPTSEDTPVPQRVVRNHVPLAGGEFAVPSRTHLRLTLLVLWLCALAKAGRQC